MASIPQNQPPPRYTLTEIDASSGQATKTYVLSTTPAAVTAHTTATHTNGHSFRLDEIPLTASSAASKQHDPPPLNRPWTSSLTNALSSNTLAIQTYLSTLFLPTGYPHTVTPDYTPYQIYDSLQAFASSIAGLLSSRAVLQSLNVVDNSTPNASTATAATLLSVVQSTLSNLTTILFASHAAPRISADVKYYRFLADIVNDAAFVLDLLAPSLPSSFSDLTGPFFEGNKSWGIALALAVGCWTYAVSRYDRTSRAYWSWTSSLAIRLTPIAVVWLLRLDHGSGSRFFAGHVPSPRVVVLCLSSVLRAICGVAGGSSKAVLSAHFARNNPENIGDLNAKDGSQETVVGLIGMWVGGVVVSRVEGRVATWFWMIGLLGMHLWCNWRAVRSVRLRGLNRERAGLVCKEVVERGEGWKSRVGVEEIGRAENVLRLWTGGIDTRGWGIGVPIDVFVRAVDGSSRRSGIASSLLAESALIELLPIFENELYLLWVDQEDGKVTIALKKGVQPVDQLKAWYHAFLMQEAAKNGAESAGCPSIKETLVKVNGSWDEVCRILNKVGWELDSTILEDGKGSRLELRQ